jgi:hypothetical protein
MTVESKGDCLICEICGHLALPSNPLFECTCSKCVALRSEAEGVETRGGMIPIQGWASRRVRE